MDKAQIFLSIARRVIRAEADGLVQLADGLGGEFAEAVELMLGARGRVIVSNSSASWTTWVSVTPRSSATRLAWRSSASSRLSVVFIGTDYHT